MLCTYLSTLHTSCIGTIYPLWGQLDSLVFDMNADRGGYLKCPIYSPILVSAWQLESNNWRKVVLEWIAGCTRCMSNKLVLNRGIQGVCKKKIFKSRLDEGVAEGTGNCEMPNFDFNQHERLSVRGSCVSNVVQLLSMFSLCSFDPVSHAQFSQWSWSQKYLRACCLYLTHIKTVFWDFRLKRRNGVTLMWSFVSRMQWEKPKR